MNADEKAHMEAFLNQALIARMGTLNPRTMQPHVTAVWYGWDGESLWISAFTSTRKVKELIKHKLCSIIIDTVTDDPLKNLGVIMEGKAELISGPGELVQEKTTWVYTRYLGPEGVLAPDPQSWIVDPENLLVKLTPEKIYTWF